MLKNTKSLTDITKEYDVWVVYDGKSYNLRITEEKDYIDNWEMNRMGRFCDKDHYPEDFMDEVIDYALENWDTLTEVKPESY
jgi:hypothetical protein